LTLLRLRDIVNDRGKAERLCAPKDTGHDNPDDDDLDDPDRHPYCLI